MSSKSLKLALAEGTAELMGLPGVFGIAEGLCNGLSCIIVYVDAQAEGLHEQIPEEVAGYPVRIKEAGKFRPTDET